jgi:F420-non-reducing hydrogenase iron-sulfur subunit
MTDEFDPQITIFACYYCAYGAADLAGSMRLPYPDSTRIVKLPCSGKLDVILVLDALEHGADGVMVAG